MSQSFENDPLVIEAKRFAERGIGCIDTLHLGPVDYNIGTTADYLRTAAGLIEDFGRAYLRRTTTGAV